MMVRHHLSSNQNRYSQSRSTLTHFSLRRRGIKLFKKSVTRERKTKNSNSLNNLRREGLPRRHLLFPSWSLRWARSQTRSSTKTSTWSFSTQGWHPKSSRMIVVYLSIPTSSTLKRSERLSSRLNRMPWSLKKKSERSKRNSKGTRRNYLTKREPKRS